MQKQKTNRAVDYIIHTFIIIKLPKYIIDLKMLLNVNLASVVDTNFILR